MKFKTFDPASMTPDALTALESAGFSRRDFLRGAGALIVGFAAAKPQPARAQDEAGLPQPRVVAPAQVDTWVAISADETVWAYSGKCEFGQGFSTVQVQLVAEELSVPFSNVRLTFCDTALCPDQGVTSGSQSHPAEFGLAGLRQALATARQALFQMAAERLNAPMNQLVVNDGVISMRNDPSRQVSYATLVGGKQFALALNASAVTKDPASYTVLGQSYQRLDLPAKMTGQFRYVQHVRVPGMLHGKVVRPPVVGATVVSIDESSVSGLPGNVRVVRKNDFVGVVADKEYQALKAAETLKVTWSDAPALPDQATLYDWMRQQPTRDSYIVLANDVDDKLKSAAKTVSARYVHPFQMHGSLASSCAVADIQGAGAGGKGTIWSATQGVYPQRDSVARVLDIPRENIRVVFVEGSGCYGINGNDSVSYDAAILSQAVGKPVRVQYTRKDEMTGADHFGPAYVIEMKAGLDDKNEIVAWDYEAWTFAKGGRPNANTPGNIPSGALAGFPTPAVVAARANPPTNYSNNSNADSSYGAGCVGGRCGGTGKIQTERVLVHTIQSPFFTGPLRSPNRLQNTFANESFIDEIAASVKADPVEYRLRFLADQRMIDVLNGAARGAGWDTRPSPRPGNPRTGIVKGRGISVVLYEGDNGYCAVVAEMEVNQDTGEVVVTRFVSSQDSGPVSNPDGIRNQMEGGTLQGMSRALREEITWNDRSLRSVDWARYPVWQWGERIPLMENVVIDRKNVLQMGAGECTITAVAAAMANAIFDATGARIRQVPFTPRNVLAALRARG